jgi:Skp family chaperone for outer membrane proteins
MKNLQTYEQYLLENWPSYSFDGQELKVGKSVRSFDGYSGIIVSKESVNGKVQYRDHKGVVRIVESYELTSDEMINEDMTWWEVTKGILAADLIKVGLGFAGGGVLLAGVLFANWRNKVANKIEKIKKDKKYEELKTQAQGIADKFNGDEDLTKMMQDLEKYPFTETTFLKSGRNKDKATKQNNERNRVMREISKYVKSKLTPEELPFFVEINKILRDQPLTDNTGNTVEEDVVSDPSRTVGTGTYTATTSDSNYMVGGSRDTTDASSGGSTFFQ